MNVMWLPRLFYEDHRERGLPSGEVITWAPFRVRVSLTDFEMDEIEDDARHYSDPAVKADMGKDYHSLCVSAERTVRAIVRFKQHYVDEDYK